MSISILNEELEPERREAANGNYNRNGSAAVKDGFDWVDLEEEKPTDEAIALAPGDFALKNQLLPLRVEGKTLVVAMGAPESLSAVDELGILLQMPTRAVLGSPTLVRSKIEEIFLEKILAGLPGADQAGNVSDIDDTTDLADLQKMAGETAVVQMVNLIFAQAVRDGASDIHIEPYEREMKVRYRIDGMLRDVMSPPKRMHAAVVSRLKILGEMNIAERRLPQDGRIKITIAGRNVDVRVSIVPTVFGERAVMRILDKGTAMLGLEELGMRPDTLERYRRMIKMPHGVILATGPTGSGKSTTLYASLQEIWSPTTNILTIEDPVEYQVPGISQIQVRPQIGLTFASGLRSIVRQDPDIIMVGEIRDHETAEIAIHAALTGHLVFSTLHTNDSPGAVTRLLDMGVEPYLVASSLIGAVAQRLVRRVCSFCAAPDHPESEILEAIGLSPNDIPRDNPFRRGRGCDKCSHSGYRGRVALYEMFTVDEHIRRLTVDRASSTEMKDYAIRDHAMRTLLGDGQLAVLAGMTTPEEVMRVCARETI
jgi:type II secretion system protein E